MKANPVNEASLPPTAAEILSAVTVKKHFKQMSVTHPNPALTVTVIGTTDADLSPALYPGSFVRFQDLFSVSAEYGDTLSLTPSGDILVNKPCQLGAHGYLDMTHSTQNSTAAVTIAIVRSGVTILSPRSVHAKMPNSGDIGNLAGEGFVDALAGDEIYLSIASDKSGDISVRSASMFFDTTVLEAT